MKLNISTAMTIFIALTSHTILAFPVDGDTFETRSSFLTTLNGTSTSSPSHPLANDLTTPLQPRNAISYSFTYDFQPNCLSTTGAEGKAVYGANEKPGPALIFQFTNTFVSVNNKYLDDIKGWAACQYGKSCLTDPICVFESTKAGCYNLCGGGYLWDQIILLPDDSPYYFD